MSFGSPMSYVPPAYGGYPAYGSLDLATIQSQEKEATNALDSQASIQEKMLNHQYAALSVYF